jgi:hypothetical protein
MENEEVVVETENPQENDTLQTEVPAEPEKDYKQMFEDQRRRAEKAEREAKELQGRLASNHVTLEEEGSGDEETVAIKSELREIKTKLAKAELLEAHPVLKESWNDFEKFREEDENKGMNLRTAAKSFMVERGLLEPQRKGLEKPTGGTKIPSSTNTSPEEVTKLRTTDHRKYRDMLLKGQIKV